MIIYSERVSEGDMGVGGMQSRPVTQVGIPGEITAWFMAVQRFHMASHSCSKAVQWYPPPTRNEERREPGI